MEQHLLWLKIIILLILSELAAVGAFEYAKLIMNYFRTYRAKPLNSLAIIDQQKLLRELRAIGRVMKTDSAILVNIERYINLNFENYTSELREPFLIPDSLYPTIAMLKTDPQCIVITKISHPSGKESVVILSSVRWHELCRVITKSEFALTS